jgi:hypothetical protein
MHAWRAGRFYLLVAFDDHVLYYDESINARR